MLVVGIGPRSRRPAQGSSQTPVNRAQLLQRAGPSARSKATTDRNPAPKPTRSSRALGPQLTAKSRLQQQDVAMSLRVEDLSGATQSAVRTTPAPRRLRRRRRLRDRLGGGQLPARAPRARREPPEGDRQLHRARDDPLAAHLGRRPPGRARPRSTHGSPRPGTPAMREPSRASSAGATRSSAKAPTHMCRSS